MREWRLHFSIKIMSRLLKVSRSGFYAWLERPPSLRALEDERLKVAIKAAHMTNRESYSARRLQPELAADGFVAGRDRISRLRREMGIRCRRPCSSKNSTRGQRHFKFECPLLTGHLRLLPLRRKPGTILHRPVPLSWQDQVSRRAMAIFQSIHHL